MVEAGFIASSLATESENIVCMRINSLLFRKPVKRGQIVSYKSSIVFTGKTSLTAYVRVSNSNSDEFIVDDFFTYVYVNENGELLEHTSLIKQYNFLKSLGYVLSDDEEKFINRIHNIYPVFKKSIVYLMMPSKQKPKMRKNLYSKCHKNIDGS